MALQYQPMPYPYPMISKPHLEVPEIHIEEDTGSDYSYQSDSGHDPETSHELHMQGKLSAERYRNSHNINDLNEAIAYFEEAANLADPQGKDIGAILNRLSVYVVIRYERAHHTEDLQAAIRIGEECLRASSRKQKSVTLARRVANLARRYEQRYLDISSAQADFERAIDLLRDALSLVVGNRLQTGLLMHTMSATWNSKFSKEGHLGALYKAITWSAESLKHISSRDGWQWADVGSYHGNLLHARYTQVKDIRDLRGCIACFEHICFNYPSDQQVAVKTQSPTKDDPDPDRKNAYQFILSQYQTELFDITNDPGDLNEAVYNAQRAFENTPQYHPAKAERHAHLQTVLCEYTSLMGLAPPPPPIHDTISELEQKLNRIPEIRSSERADTLQTLSTTLFKRYRATSSLQDLKQAKSKIHESISLTGDKELEKRAKRMYEFCLMCNKLYWEERDKKYIFESIPIARHAVDMCDNDNAFCGGRSSTSKSPNNISVLTHALCLDSLAYTLATKFDAEGKVHLQDMKEAIYRAQRAVDITPTNVEEYAVDLDTFENHVRIFTRELEEHEWCDVGIY